MLLKPLKLVGYARNTGSSSDTVADQTNAIKRYCERNHYVLMEIFVDGDGPGLGLAQAFETLSICDGLILSNVRLLAQHKDDSLCNLRPLIDNHFMHAHKKLISIEDGIENVTPSGQHNLMTLLNEWSLREEGPKPTIDIEAHNMYTANNS